MIRKTNVTKAAASIFAAAMGMSAAVPAMAATVYTPVAGSSTTFDKFLIIGAGDTVPNAQFAFTIAPGAAVSADTADNTVFQVLPGVGTPTATPVTFAPADTESAIAANQAATNGDIDVQRAASARGNGLTAATGVELEGSKGEKYVVKTSTIDFSGCSFNEPGIYRYIVTETANVDHEHAGIMHDNDVDRVLDVYVTDDGSGVLSVAGYVMHTDINDTATPAISTDMGTADVAAAGAALADKTDGFTNEFKSKDLVFKKEVEGNQASRDKYFEFTAQVANVADTDVFVVSLANDNDANTTDGNADATSGTTAATIAANQGKTNPTSVTGAQLKAGVKFYLQHGQSIAIRGLAPNAKYTITENKEDYKQTGAAVTGYTDATTSGDNTIADIANADGSADTTHKAAMTSYKNTRNGLVPTGVIMTVAPYAAVVLLGGAGATIMMRKKDEE